MLSATPNLISLRIPRHVRWCARKHALRSPAGSDPPRAALCLRPSASEIRLHSSVCAAINCGGRTLSHGEDMDARTFEGMITISKDDYFVTSPKFLGTL